MKLKLLSHELFFSNNIFLSAGSISDKFPEETCVTARKSSVQGLTNGVTNKSNIELMFAQDNGKTSQSEKATKQNLTRNIVSKKLSEDHNLNELENRLMIEQEGRLPNGHSVRSLPLSGGKRICPARNVASVNLCDENEDSDSGDSSNTSSSSCSTVNKKDSRNKSTSQVDFNLFFFHGMAMCY